MTSEHSKQRRSGVTIVAKLLSLIGSLGYVILLAVANGSLGHTIAIMIPVLGSLAIAKACGAAVAASYGVLFGLIVGFGFLRGALRYFEQYSNHYIAFRLLAKIRDIIFRKLRVLCPAKLESKQKGAIISMITADTETIEVFYAHTVSPVCIAAAASGAMILLIGFVASWYMAAFALCAYLIVGVILPIAFNKKTAETGRIYRQKFTKFNGYFMDAIKGSRDVILHGKEKNREETVEQYTDDLLSASDKLKNRSLSNAILTNGTVVVLNLLMLILGLFLVRYDGLSAPLMTVGLVALMSSYAPVLAIAALPSDLSQTFASGDRLISLLEETPAVTDVEGGAAFDFESLRTNGLTFSYAPGKEVLRNVSVEVKPGEIVGIMGASGCGKSTFLKLLLRFWKKDGGEILYNGRDVEEIDTASLKKNVAMVSQTTYLFDDTIRGNLLIAKPDADGDALEEACKKAGIHDFIVSAKDGYETKVGGRNPRLSAGETQRLGLARAFLSDAKLILLDEPTSNVDAMNEGIILKSLAENKEGRAIVLVSHRESTMSIADRIYRFENKAAIKEV